MEFCFKRYFNQEKCIKFEHDEFGEWNFLSMKNNKFHSYNDKPSYVYLTVYKTWHKEGVLHRLNGPAKIDEYGCFYYIEGKRFDDQKQFEKKSKEYLNSVDNNK